MVSTLEGLSYQHYFPGPTLTDYLGTTSLAAVLMRGQGRKSGFYDVLN